MAIIFQALGCAQSVQPGASASWDVRASSGSLPRSGLSRWQSDSAKVTGRMSSATSWCWRLWSLHLIADVPKVPKHTKQNGCMTRQPRQNSLLVHSLQGIDLTCCPLHAFSLPYGLTPVHAGLITRPEVLCITFFTEPIPCHVSANMSFSICSCKMCKESQCRSSLPQAL